MRPETIELLNTVCVDLTMVATKIRQDTVEVVSTNDHVQVIRHFDTLRKAVASIKEAREALKEMEERLSREQVPDVMRFHKIRNTTIEGVGRVTLSTRWSCSMIDKEKGMDWLRCEGHESLIQETVNAQTLAAFAKSLNDDQGMELPADIFKTGTMTFTSITKA